MGRYKEIDEFFEQELDSKIEGYLLDTYRYAILSKQVRNARRDYSTVMKVIDLLKVVNSD